MGQFTVYRHLRPLQVVLRPNSFEVREGGTALSNAKLDYDPNRGITFRFDVDPANSRLRFTYSICEAGNFSSKKGREIVDARHANGEGYEIDYNKNQALVENVVFFVVDMMRKGTLDGDLREFTKHLEHCIYTNQFPQIKVVK